MRLYSGPVSMFSAKAEIAAIEKNIDVAVEFVPFNLATLYAPKHPDVERINPKQEVPVLIDGAVEIYDSTQIFEYLEDLAPQPALWPETLEARALVRRLEMESDEFFFPDVIRFMPGRGSKLNNNEIEDAKARLRAYYAATNNILSDRHYLAGSFSYADIAFYAAEFFARFIGVGPKNDLPHLQSWRTRMSQRASVKLVMGKMTDYLGSFGIKAEL